MLRVDGAGTVTTAVTAPDDGRPLSDLLVAQPDGSLLATTLSTNALARIAPDGTLTYVETPVPRCNGATSMLTDAVTASDGTVWIAEFNCNQLLRYAPATGRWTTRSLGRDTPVYLASDAAGGVWFGGGLVIGHVDAAGTISRSALPTRFPRVTDVAVAPDGSAWFATQRCELVRVAPGAAPALVPAPVPVTQLAFAAAGDFWLASPARLLRTTAGALSGPVACDDTPPRTGRIRVGAKTADGPVSVAALRRHHGLTISVREPAAIDALAFYPSRLGRQVVTTVTGERGGSVRYPVPETVLRSFERILAAGRHPSFNMFATFTDLEGNPIQIAAKVRLRP